MKRRTQILLASLSFFLAFSSPNRLLIQAQETSLEAQQEEGGTRQFETAYEILEMLQTSPERYSSSLNYLRTEDDQEYTSQTLSYVKDGENYYFFNTEEPLGRYIVKTQAGKFQASYFWAEDLAGEAARRLNENPDQYRGTEIEKYYVYAQEHGQELRDVYISQSQNQNQHQDSYELAKKQDQYLLKILTSFIQLEGVEAKESMDSDNTPVYTYIIGQDQTKAIGELAKKEAGNDRDLQTLSQTLQASYVGTLSFSMQREDLVLSIAAVNGSNVLEYRIGPSNLLIPPFKSDQIQTVKEFNQKTKTNLLQ